MPKRLVTMGRNTHDDAPEVRAAAAEALVKCAAMCVPELLAASHDPHAHVRFNVIDGLVSAWTDKTIQRVQDCLRCDPDPEVRDSCAYFLGQARDETFVDALLLAARDPHPAVRVRALGGLRECSDERFERVISVLIDALADPSPDVREQACRALRYSKKEAIPALITALTDDACEVRSAALMSLGSLDAIEATGTIAELMRSDPDQAVRVSAASALSEMPGAAGLRWLLDSWASDAATPSDRAARLEALGGIRDAAALPPLCQALQDPDPDIRLIAAEGVGACMSWSQTDLSPVRKALCEAATDGDHQVREAVLRALAETADLASVPTFERAATDDDDEVRLQAYRGLARLRSHEFEDLLLAGLNDPCVYVQQAAANGLAFLDALQNWQAVLSHFENPESSHTVRAALATVLVRSRHEVAREVLAKSLTCKETPDDLRAAVCVALQDHGGEEFREQLVTLLDAEDAGVRSEAALALGATTDQSAFDALRRRLRKEKSPHVRRRIVWASSFFDPECLPLLTKSLDDPDLNVREQAVRALAEVCNEDELSFLLENLPRRISDDVRDSLTEALESRDPGMGRMSRSEREVKIGTTHYE